MDAADAYYDDTAELAAQAATIVLGLWLQRVSVDDIDGSWAEAIPIATAAVAAAQWVTAELIDPYLAELLDDGPSVDGAALAGQVPGGGDIGSLLYLPVRDAKQRITEGIGAHQALRQAQSQMAMYVRTTVADTARMGATAGMVGRRAAGYHRRLRLPSCARCAILAGRFYAWNAGFRRHPRCDCQHVPVRDAGDDVEFDARAAIASGQVRMTQGAREAVLLGADPAQVVNAGQGMYRVGEFTATSTGTTRRGVAGARILARDIDRAQGKPTTGVYTNWTIDRLHLARFLGLMRRGKTFTRTTSTGHDQTVAYRLTRTPRPTPEQIIASAQGRDDAIRLLTNYGYLL
ncbi:MAG: hypothetical protein M3443_11020 [Actinomycetota bacterium]|nr:hypothetical protein [Actinomycetota bacterium]